MKSLSMERALMAVENVRERLLNSTQALDRAGVSYAVIGGNAVAAWVARIDPDAVRNTVDVDLLIRRNDLNRVASALSEIGYDAAEVQGVTVFVERASPSVRRGLHILFANERVRPHYALPTPDPSQSQRADDGYAVIDLLPLLQMKLTSFRRKDQVHLDDMLELGMITPEIDAALPAELRARLDELRANPQ